ncbi:MAG: PEP-CTERM sorting domain-containing protein, partial [Cyanobacteria bacterium P01_H01_bin.130]
LRAKALGDNYFNLGNNHRGESGLSGWGWLEYRLKDYGNDDQWYNGGVSDWIFTGEKVPEPSMTLGLLAIGGLMMSRRKRSAQA